MLLNILRCTGQNPKQGIIWPQTSVVLRLRNSELNQKSPGPGTGSGEGGSPMLGTDCILSIMLGKAGGERQDVQNVALALWVHGGVDVAS